LNAPRHVQVSKYYLKPLGEERGRFMMYQCDVAVYEPEIVNVIAHVVRPGDLVVDAGANMGVFTVILSKMVGDAGKVIAFEPEFRGFNYLMDNIGLNKLTNVEAFKHGLFSHDCQLDLWIPGPSGYSSCHHYLQSESSEKIWCRPLDDLALDRQPRFMKIDCEGVEEEILRGGERMLRTGVDFIVLELNFHLMRQVGRSDRTLRDYMHSLGYEMYLIHVLADGGGYCPPDLIETRKALELMDNGHINVMFSTPEKIKECWQ